jgi:Fur family transcriptional regulator, peroxide stress response regulator
MYRRSKQKTAILRVIQGTHSHPDAEWIFGQVKKEIPNISLGTVYRNLKILKEAGVIREVYTAGEMGHFDGKSAKHYHFRCDRCGEIYDLDEKVDKAIEDRVARKTGFQVTDHDLELSGLCINCQNIKYNHSEKGER